MMECCSSGKEHLLRVERLRVRRNGSLVLADASLHVDTELVLVMGANGSGKSTLLRTLMGVHRLEAGEIWLEGRCLNGRPTDEIVRLGMAMVPESRRIFARLTVEENLWVGATTTSRSGSEVRSRVDKAFDLFPELTKYRHRRAGGLSGGEQQMLAVARALAVRPKMLLCDEPTMGLAPELTHRVLQGLGSLPAGGVGVLAVVQLYSSFVLPVGPRAYMLENGALREA
jgi:branched-chain amino acid transport system ATP-binding protein